MRQLLIVDDDVAFVEVTTDWLEEQGFRVETAYLGEEALFKLDSFQPELLICDLTMPGMDGFALLQHVRARPGLHTLPVIILTGYRQEARQISSWEGRSVSFLTKPFEPDELLSEIRRHLP